MSRIEKIKGDILMLKKLIKEAPSEFDKKYWKELKQAKEKQLVYIRGY